MTQGYTYACHGRRAGTLLALGFVVLLLYVALTNDAPLIIWLIWVPSAAGLLWLVLANPRTTVTLTSDELRVVEGKAVQAIPINRVAGIEIREWTDAHDIFVRFDSGELEQLTLVNPPPVDAFSSACKALGIPIVRR